MGMKITARRPPCRRRFRFGPRFATDTDQFELVGVLDGQVLTLYLDQFGSNEPVAKAQIEIERGTWKALATEVSPGVYAVAAPALAQPGKHVLTVTVQAGDKSDLLNATLEVGAVNAASARHAAGRAAQALVGLVGAAALAAGRDRSGDGAPGTTTPLAASIRDAKP